MVTKVGEFELKRPPTDICAAFGRIYVSTKSKRIFCIDPAAKTQKSILFSGQVNAFAASEDTLFCACKDDKIFGINSAHKTVFKSNADGSEAIRCVFDKVRDSLLVATAKQKIMVLGSNSMLKNTFYSSYSPIVGLGCTTEGKVAVATENCSEIKIFCGDKKEPEIINASGEFIACFKLISRDLLIAGLANKKIALINIKTKKKIAEVETDSEILSIGVISSSIFVVGCVGKTMSFYTIVQSKIEHSEHIALTGLPVAFVLAEKQLAVAVSRESAYGRWARDKSAQNAVLLFDI
ncbi:hypothetical protein ENBRE01_0925 [Enteropsectra breve]|nr:hypothetical protein ENBRE01_0925 [Enteropsectra breve]